MEVLQRMGMTRAWKFYALGVAVKPYAEGLEPALEFRVRQ